MCTIRMLLLALAVSSAAHSARADVITDWDEKAIAFVTPRTVAPEAQRQVTLVHAAMFDAVNSIERRYRPYRVQLPAAATASKEAAAAAAAATVLAALHPQLEKEVKAALTTYLGAMQDNEAKSEGSALGASIAAKILEARVSDGSNASDGYRPKTRPGVYVPTAITVGSMFPKVTPFAITSASQFRPGPPISLESEQWATDYNEIKDYGGKASSKRSAQQTENARFWLMTGPQAYHPIARQLVAAKNMSVTDSARFMALVAMAEADAYISVMDAKYQYDFWRPITAIRNGDLHNDRAMTRDANWQPLDNTPMHPEYPCAHCICGAALAAVVETAFGSAKVPEVSMTSPTAPGITHRWTNVWALANEVSEARIWSGFHYRFSANVGQDMGRKIGQYIVKTTMLPANAEAR
jgi:hypothetical protein